jgi:hypothetical protein
MTKAADPSRSPARACAARALSRPVGARRRSDTDRSIEPIDRVGSFHRVVSSMKPIASFHRSTIAGP